MAGKKEGELGNSILAIIGGTAAAAAALFVLYFLFQFVIDWYFDLYLFEDDKKIPPVHQFIFFVSMLAWLLLSAWAGGLVCALICRLNEYKHTAVLIGLTAIAYLFIILSSGIRPKDVLIASLFFIFISVAFLSGANKGIRIKNRKNSNKNV